MAVYDLEEQEQLDELKTWWKQYGNLVTGGLIAVAVGMAGWQSWNWWQRNQAAQAGALYSVVERAAGAHDAKKAREAAGELIDKYSGTSYAGMAALLSARMQVEAADRKTAKAELGWAQEHAHDAELRDLARLRLAALLLDEKAYDESLKLLTAEPGPSFAPRFAELKGDVLAAQGKADDAKAAYQAALNKIDEAQKNAGPAQRQGAYRELVLAKLESLGSAGGKKP
mgnify:CR=1 FL=1